MPKYKPDELETYTEFHDKHCDLITCDKCDKPVSHNWIRSNEYEETFSCYDEDPS